MPRSSSAGGAHRSASSSCSSTAGDTNEQAGSVAGYNGIVGAPPFNRTEILEAWYLQEMMKDVLKMRIGRSLPTYDFGNVLRPVALADPDQNIPAVSGLLWSPDLRQPVDDRRSWATTTRPTA